MVAKSASRTEKRKIQGECQLQSARIHKFGFAYYSPPLQGATRQCSYLAEKRGSMVCKSENLLPRSSRVSLPWGTVTISKLWASQSCCLATKAFKYKHCSWTLLLSTADVCNQLLTGYCVCLMGWPVLLVDNRYLGYEVILLRRSI